MEKDFNSNILNHIKVAVDKEVHAFNVNVQRLESRNNFLIQKELIAAKKDMKSQIKEEATMVSRNPVLKIAMET